MKSRTAFPSLFALALLSSLLAGGSVRADEIRLKDGTKITGTIVGFENDSFKIETSYGFALVKKDKIAAIIPSAPKKEPESKPKQPPPPPPADAKQPEVPAVAPASVKTTEPPVANKSVVAAEAPSKTAPEPPKPQAKEAAHSPAQVSKANPAAAASASPPAPEPAKPQAIEAASVSLPAEPEPPAIRDEVRGNLYLNHTYGFEMYKPPSWDLIAEARKALPDAVAALGTSDETTLLVIGRVTSKDSLDAHAAATDKQLQDIYDNYRLLSSRRAVVAGAPALERHFRGTVNDHDWSVTVVTFVRGPDIYTLLGMTYAETDLIQVQENVIAKAISSLQFNTIQ